jgi:hypothetical protein
MLSVISTNETDITQCWRKSSLKPDNWWKKLPVSRAYSVVMECNKCHEQTQRISHWCQRMQNTNTTGFYNRWRKPLAEWNRCDTIQIKSITFMTSIIGTYCTSWHCETKQVWPTHSCGLETVKEVNASKWEVIVNQVFTQFVLHPLL